MTNYGDMRLGDPMYKPVLELSVSAQCIRWPRPAADGSACSFPQSSRCRRHATRHRLTAASLLSGSFKNP